MNKLRASNRSCFMVQALLSLSLAVSACGGGGAGSSSQTPQTTTSSNNTPSTSTSNGNSGNAGPIADSGVSVFNPSLVTDAVQVRNLLEDGSFVAPSDDWFSCGATIESEPVRGDYLRLNGNNICQTSEFGLDTLALAYTSTNISAMPEYLYISFLARSSQPIELFGAPFNVYLTDQPGFVEPFRGEALFSSATFNAIGRDWTRVKVRISMSEVQGWIGDLPPLWLFFEQTNTAYTIDIDDISLSTTEPINAQADQRPTSLNSVDDELLFMNTRLGVAASARANGSNYQQYDEIETDQLRMAPVWFGNSHIVTGEFRFNPLVSADAAVVPAEGTELFSHDIVTGSKDLLFQTLGSPGRFDFDGAPTNLAAVDVSIRNGVWDVSRDIGAFGVCARNRLVSVSDDFCSIFLLNTDGTHMNPNSSLEGYNPALSQTGKIAYVDFNSVYTADIAQYQIVNSQTVFSGPSPEAVAWSPDGGRLAVLSQAPLELYIDGSLNFGSSIKVVNLSSSETTEILSIDHGFAYPRLVWLNGGEYIVYSIRLTTNGQDQLWWLEVATGKTGPITNTISAAGVSAQPNP